MIQVNISHTWYLLSERESCPPVQNESLPIKPKDPGITKSRHLDFEPFKIPTKNVV